MQYGVDLVLWGHVHAYERLWPVYDNVVLNGTLEEPYTNPGAPVHLISGSAVSRERSRSSSNISQSRLSVCDVRKLQALGIQKMLPQGVSVIFA